MKFIRLTLCAALIVAAHFLAVAAADADPKTAAPQNDAVREVTRAFLLDRIRGGWTGMLIGGLEGLPHEFKYNEQPRATLPEFTFLEQGARSDDDNDFEWTHLWYMDEEGVLKLPYPRLVAIWKTNMNQGIWVANKQARELMDEGMVPPATGSTSVNPHAGYNLSGQFCVEAYGMIAPGMPQTAAEVGLHYARIAVSEEPLQAAQFWTSLISLMAFHEGPMETALDAALAAVDPASAMAEVVTDARRLHREHPRDWKAARQAIHEKWVKQKKWNMNSTPSNGALVLLALLYGEGDFYKTLQYAMALGYDADCNAATAGAVLGTRLGFRHIAALPQFRMPDRYLNKTRPSLPAECKVSEQAETLMRVCERVILAHGGERIEADGQPGYRVLLQSPRLISGLDPARRPVVLDTNIGSGELWSSTAPLMDVLTNAPVTKFPPASALPPRPELPDPLVMLDGRRVATREQWLNERRPELAALFQHYMYGALPPKPGTISARLEREDRRALGGKATLKEVAITFGPPELRPIHLMLVAPNRREVPAPVVLGMNYFGNHTLLHDPSIALSTNWMPERGTGVVNNLSTDASRGTWADIWRIEYLVDRGYALATFYNGDIDPDRPDARGIQSYYRRVDPTLDCATIAAWAWGLSRAVDYLVTDKDVDRHRIVVTGHSRLGKAALLAAALDERIALAIPHQAGSGGSAPSRTSARPAISSRRENAPYPLKAPETVTQLNDKFPHWFNARFKEFNDRPERLPFDQHCLVALCAPRPVLFTNGRDDTWINPDGQFEVLRAAAPVYRLLGAGDFAATNPPPDGRLVDSTLGFFLRPGAHSLKPEDWKAFLDFSDKHLGLPGKPRTAALPVLGPHIIFCLPEGESSLQCAYAGDRILCEPGSGDHHARGD